MHRNAANLRRKEHQSNADTILVIHFLSLLVSILTVAGARCRHGENRFRPNALVLASGWQLQDAAKVPQAGSEVAVRRIQYRRMVSRHSSGNRFDYAGEQSRLSRAALWREQPPRSDSRKPGAHIVLVSEQRSKFRRSYKNRRVWLNFDGINYSATVWVNGTQVGTIRGAFIRGIFDITSHVHSRQERRGGRTGVHRSRILASRTNTTAQRVGHRTAAKARIDGPTFLCDAGMGLDSRRFATATPASGRRSFFLLPARWW